MNPSSNPNGRGSSGRCPTNEHPERQLAPGLKLTSCEKRSMIEAPFNQEVSSVSTPLLRDDTRDRTSCSREVVAGGVATLKGPS